MGSEYISKRRPENVLRPRFSFYTLIAHYEPGDITMAERMGALTPETMTEAQRKAAEELASGPRGRVSGPFNVLLRSPELLSPVQKVGEYLRFRCKLDRRIAEFAT